MTPLTEQENRLIHAFVEPEGCWHDFGGYAGNRICLNCNQLIGYYTVNPSYTDDAPFNNLLKVLFGEEGMWEQFWFSEFKKVLNGDVANRANSAMFAAYLFHPAHRDRFCRLFIDFLGLEETQKEFGTIECTEYIQSRHSSSAECALRGTERCENDCHGSGHIPRPWFKVMKEESCKG